MKLITIRVPILAKTAYLEKDFSPSDVRKYLDDNYEHIYKKEFYKVHIKGGAVILARYNGRSELEVLLPHIQYQRMNGVREFVKGMWLKAKPTAIGRDGKEHWNISNTKYSIGGIEYSRLAVENYQKLSGKKVPDSIPVI